MRIRGNTWQKILGGVLCASSLEAAVLLENNFEDGSVEPWVAYSITSNADWAISDYNGNQYASMNGYGADTASDDWLISPVINFDNSNNEILTFETAKNFDGGSMEALVSTDYDGVSSPETFTWTPLSATYSTGDYVFTASGPIDLSDVAGDGYIAFRYISTGTNSGEGAVWQVDNILLEEVGGIVLSIAVDQNETLTNQEVTFTAGIAGGTAPYSYAWDLGDGTTSDLAEVTHAYANEGNYTVSVEVTDAENVVQNVEVANAVTVIQSVDIAVPTKMGDVRIATFNVSMNRPAEGDLAAELQNGESEQIGQVTQIIQAVNPDIILINEFDFGGNGSVDLFLQNYLKQGDASVDYPYYFVAPSNTGIPSGYDFDNNGATDDAGDGYGFGAFPGQYGMLVLSKYPIDTEGVRTFQNFLWKDMPNAVMPIDPETNTTWYNEAETAVFRLSSKSHWDVPVVIDGKRIHVLASHPTPPVFDGSEDRNGKRNHDEIRFWADYISGDSYMYDDAGETGGLDQGRFVILGDQNADPDEGDSYNNAINQLLGNALVDATVIPESDGAEEQAGDRDDTASFDFRVDYVLPSACGFEPRQSGHFWPTTNDVKHNLLASSDHRLVWADMDLTGCATAGDQNSTTPEPNENNETVNDDNNSDNNSDNDDDDGVLPATTPWSMMLMLLSLMGMAAFALRTQKQ